MAKGGQKRRLVRSGMRLLVLGVPLLFWAPLHAALAAPAPLQVEIRGLQGELLANVTAALAPPPGLMAEGGLDPYWLERFVGQVPALVDQALRPYGHYRSETQAQLQSVAEGRYLLLVKVAPGDPVRVARRDLAIGGSGAGEPTLQALLRTFPLAAGEVLRQDRYEQAKGELKAKAVDLGYLDAEFARHVVAIEPDRSSCAIELLLDTGPRYRFGPLFISVDRPFAEGFIRRNVTFAEGELFSYAQLGRTQLNLLNTDRFHDVVVNPRRELTRDRQVPIHILLKANPRHRLKPGVGYGTDTGPRFSLRYQNLSVFDLGHEFRTDLNVAASKQALNLTYIIPEPQNLASETRFKLGFERENPATYESRTLFIEGERLRGFGENRIGSAYLRLQQEDYIVGLQDDRARLVIPGLRWRDSYLDHPLDPTQGYRYRLEVRGTDQSLGSDTSLLQLFGGGDALVPLPVGFSLLLRGEGGATWQDDPLSEVPPTLRFFAGGDRSVRGYGYNSLGPVDAVGKVIGGRHLLVGSAEIEYALFKEWGLALFFDVGNAFDSWTDFELRQGVGFGLRRKTVIGPVKVDLARQIRVDDPSWRLHVTIGFGW